MKAFHSFCILFLLLGFSAFAQSDSLSSNQKKVSKQIEIVHADFTDKNEDEIPGATILTGKIEAIHDSIYIYCNKAYLFQKDNYIKLFGNVKMIQNDTLEMQSNYAEYNGLDKIAYASGNVVMKSPDSKLTSEKVYYDKAKGKAYYNDHAVIVNKENTLKSKEGIYYTSEQKFEFRSKVELTNKDSKINSDHLDYYETTGQAYLFGPSTVETKKDFLYTENGFYDTRLELGELHAKSYILTDNKRIEGQQMYYDKKAGYSKAVNFVKVTDTINKMILTSHFAEVFQHKDGSDSIFLEKKPLVKLLSEKDSTFFHAPKIFITGLDKHRRLKAFTKARLFREPDLSALADSLQYNQTTGLLKMLGKPVLFKSESQITGKEIHLLNNPETEKLDSLKVLTDAFLIEKDTLGTGFNQAKGINLYGKFKDNKLSEVDLIQNAEMIYYVYDRENELTGVDKGICSLIHLEFEDNKIAVASRITDPKSETNPPEQFSESLAKFSGFNWRGAERIKNKDEIFLTAELDKDSKALEEKQLNDKENQIPVTPENKDFKSIKSTSKDPLKKVNGDKKSDK